MTITETETLYSKKGTRYVPTTLAEQGAWGWESLMVMAAFRYCCGRQTYIVGVCVDWLIGKWAHVPEKERLLIRRDLEAEFKRDDEARASGEKCLPLGWDCDRKDWERVRALWSDAPPAAPVQQSPEEIARRARWLVTEMEAVGSAMVRVAQASGDQKQEAAGRDLQDAGSALARLMEQKT